MCRVLGFFLLYLRESCERLIHFSVRVPRLHTPVTMSGKAGSTDPRAVGRAANYAAPVPLSFLSDESPTSPRASCERGLKKKKNSVDISLSDLVHLYRAITYGQNEMMVETPQTERRHLGARTCVFSHRMLLLHRRRCGIIIIHYANEPFS